MKVWYFSEGSKKWVATPVTRGRHPEPGKRSERRVYGLGANVSDAIEALLSAIGYSGEIEAIKLA